jgi:hypothetical protein
MILHQTPLLITRLAKTACYSLAVLFISSFSVLILYTNARYFLNIDTGFLLTKTPEALASYFYLPAFYTHISTGSLVLLCGALQFNSTLRNRTQTHRISGKIYVWLTLFLAAPSGFVMGIYANGGILVQINFMILAVLWFTSTFVALKQITKLDYDAHRNFMIRSYALALSAVMLRFYSFIGASIFGAKGEMTYLWISWLSWIPNLIACEIYIRLRTNFHNKV